MNSLDKSIRKQEWKNAVEAWQASGLSIKKWCDERGMADSTFHYWKKVFLPPKVNKSSFIELQEESKLRKIEMEYAGIKIYVENGFDENLLVHCLKVLKKVSSC